MGVSASNRSCPPMHRSLRYPNGHIISELDWKSIREATIHIARKHLVPLDSLAPHVGTGQRRKKTLYKRQFLSKWDKAMRELKKMAPLLSYCAGSWKADMVLGSVLQDDRLSEPLPSPAPSHRAASHSATPSVAPPPCSASRRGSHHSHTALSRASTPSGAPTSRASQMSPPTGPTSSASQQPPSPSVRKAGGSKAKRKRELSPAPHDGKKAKSTENVSSSGAKTGFFFFSFSFSFSFSFLSFVC